MAFLGPILPALSAITTIAGGAVGAIGAIQAGNAAKADAEFRAKQMEQRANEERAVGQRQMFERRREGELQQSRLRALAGAASGDTTDTGVLNLGGDIEQRSEYQALTELYKGENAARGYMDAAAGARASGAAAQQGSYWKAAGSILESGSSLFKKYNSPYEKTPRLY